MRAPYKRSSKRERAKEAVQAYCKRFNLTYVDDPGHALDDRDEWAGVDAAGFDNDPSYGACVVYTSTFGIIHVVTDFADGIKRMVDRREVRSPDELVNARRQFCD